MKNYTQTTWCIKDWKQRRAMNKDKRRQILERLRENNPKPETELNWNSPFELLIAVLLSAQATDVSVNKATDKLYAVANTPQAIFDLGVDGVKEYIKTIGLFNSKAENVIKTCRILLDKHNGEVPENREALEALPGVGRKTANVVLNTSVQSHQICNGKNCRRCRTETTESRSRRIQIRRSPLVDFAWSIHLYRTQTSLWELHN